MENFVYDIDSIRGLNLSIKIPLPLFSYFIEEAFKFSNNEGNMFSVEEFELLFDRENVALSAQDIRFSINSLVYLIKFLPRYNIPSEIINRWLNENTLMPQYHREFFIQTYQNTLQVEQVKKNLTLGKLKEIKWTINRYEGEQKYSHLKRYYILLEFHIQNDEGQSEKQIVNLTLQEFKVLQMEIKEIGSVLDSYSVQTQSFQQG